MHTTRRLHKIAITKHIAAVNIHAVVVEVQRDVPLALIPVFIGKYWGARKGLTSGGCIFIDEAYQFTSEHNPGLSSRGYLTSPSSQLRRRQAPHA